MENPMNRLRNAAGQWSKVSLMKHDADVIAMEANIAFRKAEYELKDAYREALAIGDVASQIVIGDVVIRKNLNEVDILKVQVV